MSPHHTTLLGLALCLIWVIHAQEVALPRPSISAEPGSMIPWGQPVTIVCRGPAEVETFRLAWEDGSNYTDQKILPQRPPHETEARFPITRVSDNTARRYFCRYHNNSSWSEHSDFLELVVTGEDVSALPSGAPGDISSPTTQPSAGDTETNSYDSDSNNSGLSTQYVYILLVVAGAFLICLFLLVLFFLFRRHRKKLGLPSSRGKEQRPQERLSPAVDILGRTPDLAIVDSPPKKGREMHTSTSAAGGPQEVTYAQLDHRTFTQRPAHAVSPQTTEPTAETSTYAALARR
ncbi:leukocyte-associated immunoglobulin-like receptor 1 isoform X4 [Equus caballus]|uniref:leukocyte-associated immunoglobulin-like receptor 1 isoform X4 n=1 Tax=Equus caballus TaxID=9796 RepID=UPI000C9DB798|nr:leukocyte-associated immunoglobulin-like receptor 1 isoform X1 [Equus caballus]